MNLPELKARAYDLLVIFEKTQGELNKVNQEIANYKEVKPEVVEGEIVK